MDEKEIKLGKDQIKWLTQYKSIDLHEWRILCIENNIPDWYYIGNWTPKNMDDYDERRKNLTLNRYYYWNITN